MFVFVAVVVKKMIYSPRLFAASSLLLIICLTTSINAAADTEAEQQQDILRRFSTKLLLTFVGNKQAAASSSSSSSSSDQHHDGSTTSRLEIEEIYDQVRGLAKITILNSGQAERAELFYRAEDGLYLEILYSLTGGPGYKKCTASAGASEPPPNGRYFGLLQELTRGSNRSQWAAILLGPSVFLHSAQADLLARFAQRKEQIEKNTQTEPMLQKWVNASSSAMRHRFIVEQGVGLAKELNESISVEFSQADFSIDRSPLLTQLATFMSYSDGANQLRYSIDYLEIDNVTLGHLLDTSTNRDLFKFPQVRACLGVGSEPPEEQFGFNSTWLRYFQLGATRFSANLHASNLHPAGVHVAANLDKHLLRFDIDKQSRNVIDLKNELIYHMPNEPAGPEAGDIDTDLAQRDGEGAQVQTNKVRNSHCSIISSSRAFPGLRTLKWAEQALISNPGAVKRWAHLIGRPESIIYLGMDRPPSSSGQLAYEFELTYLKVDNLSPWFVILFGQDEWQVADVNRSERKLLLVGKLWIKAEEASCSRRASSHRPFDCSNPTLLLAKLDLIEQSRDGDQQAIIVSKQIHFSEFEWELFGGDSDVGKLDKIYETFDRRLCPIEKLELQFDVEWKQEIQEENFKPGEELCQHHSQLDDLVFGHINEYILTYASADVELMDVNLRQSLLGTMVAHYAITLTELPDLANSFRRLPDVSQLVPQRALEREQSHLLAKSSQFKVLFECLSWASQFGNSLGVLHSPSVGCFVYDKVVIDREMLLQANQPPPAGDVGKQQPVVEPLFAAYSRELESFRKTIRNSLSGLKLFKAEHIDTINHEIVRSNRDENGYEVCLSRPTGQSLLRDIKFSKLRHKPASSSERVPVKSGFKFTETSSSDGEQISSLMQSRRQFEVVSFTDCLRRCNEQPDCASYSHCKNVESQHQYCQLSDLKLSSKVVLDLNSIVGIIEGQNFTLQPGCHLHSKDYLLYFEPARNAAELAGGPDVQLNQWAPLGEGQTSELECASLCHQLGTDCMRFLHCHPQACYYRQPDSSAVEGSALRLFEPSDCSLFKKKNLGLYRRMLSIDFGPFEWALAENADDAAGGEPLRAELMPGPVGEEKCAQLCTDNVECQSFDSCSTAIHTSRATAVNNKHDTAAVTVRRNLPHFVCTLLSRSLSNGLLLVNQTASEVSPPPPPDDNNSAATDYELTRHCSHFERQGLRSASQLLLDRMTASNGSLKLKIDEPSADSKAAGLFSAALLGLLLGIASNMLMALARSKLSHEDLDAAVSMVRRWYRR